MWSFAIVLWELATRNVPFADLTPMEAGMKVRKTIIVDYLCLFYSSILRFLAIDSEFRIYFPISADCNGEPPSLNSSWNISTHDETHSDLYEWGPWETTYIWYDRSDYWENAGSFFLRKLQMEWDGLGIEKILPGAIVCQIVKLCFQCSVFRLPRVNQIQLYY